MKCHSLYRFIGVFLIGRSGKESWQGICRSLFAVGNLVYKVHYMLYTVRQKVHHFVFALTCQTFVY